MSLPHAYFTYSLTRSRDDPPAPRRKRGRPAKAAPAPLRKRGRPTKATAARAARIVLEEEGEATTSAAGTNDADDANSAVSADGSNGADNSNSAVSADNTNNYGRGQRIKCLHVR